MRNIRIGDYLVEQQLITAEQLQQVLTAQKENGDKRFSEIVVELGFISEVSLSKALEQKLRVPYMDLSNIDIDAEAVRRIPESLAKKYTVIAINIQGRRLTVATDDPINFDILEDIRMQTGMYVIPVLATKSAINKAIRNMYSNDVAG
ncbi:MAG: hypothetical protein K2O42_11085 [Oscillospiraceae bacterium]|nr:hypothetical protein [Oscillospiraceae bacterium]